jgi:acetyl esterase
MAMAEYDDLRSSGEAFGSLLESAGVELKSWTEPGSAHGYLNAVGAVAAASCTLGAFAQHLRTYRSNAEHCHGQGTGVDRRRQPSV